MGQVRVVRGGPASQAQLPKKFISGSVQQLVEDVVVTLSRKLESDSVLLQKVSFNVSSSKFSSLTEMGADEFSKSRGVVITHSFGISKSFHQRVLIQDVAEDAQRTRDAGAKVHDPGIDRVKRNPEVQV